MLLWHILGWFCIAAAAGIGGWFVHFSCGGWRNYLRLTPPPVPRLVALVPPADPNPGFSDYVGML